MLTFGNLCSGGKNSEKSAHHYECDCRADFRGIRPVQNGCVDERSNSSTRDLLWDTQSSFAGMQGSLADTQGSFADMQGSFADTQGSFADIRGSFAELKGLLADV